MLDNKPGRPRKYSSRTERVAAYRKRKLAEGRRFDIFLESAASWRLIRLANIWKCSRSEAVERLILEAAQQYEDILFPEMDS